jgi:quinol monooxygenase YgiN
VEVHYAITRQVRAGKEAEFEQALREFARESLRAPGVTGVHLIRPVPGTAGCEYGILRSFTNSAAAEVFYASELFQGWEGRVADWVLGRDCHLAGGVPLRASLVGCSGTLGS